jgi:PAS domain S-box-containing protein
MRNNSPVTGRAYPLRDGMTIVSRTDLKGRITAVNPDFIEASGFTEAELIGQPHNLVRHPDMPPAAFEDLWGTLKAGRPWTGLVKNRRKDGDHYWVVANVTPLLEGDQVTGYLSVRTQPTRAQIDAAEAAYRDFREGRAEGLTIRDGRVVRIDEAATPPPDRTALATGRARTVAAAGAIALLAGIGGSALQLGWLAGAALLLGGWAAWAGMTDWAGWRQHDAATAQALAQATHWLRRFSQGRFDGLVEARGEDAMAQLMRSLRCLQVRLGFEVTDTARRAAEAERIRHALDVAATNIMVADADGRIVYANTALQALFIEAQDDIRRDLPQFEARRIVGAHMDTFHRHPAHQRALLERLTAEHRTRLAIGGRSFDLILNPVVDADGHRLGVVVEWHDMTATLAARAREIAQQAEERRIKDEALRVQQALDVATVPVRIADPEGTIIYVNRALDAVLHRDAAAFRQTHPAFAPERVVGSSVGIFHADPDATLARLRTLQTPVQSRMTLGGRLYDVITSPILDANGRLHGTVGQ